MSVQWFPGHMHATRKAIAERIKGIDVVIEMIDARLPGSSANPMLAQLIDGTPTLKLLNKSDLADPARTELWLDYYNALPLTHAIAMRANVAASVRELEAACRTMAPNRGGMVKPLRVIIGGGHEGAAPSPTLASVLEPPPEELPAVEGFREPKGKAKVEDAPAVVDQLAERRKRKEKKAAAPAPAPR